MKYRKLRIAWSVAWLATLVLLLPDIEPARGPAGNVPPSRMILPMLIGMPLIAAASWLPNRFSLRSLLIGMAVAAIGLGWIVYASRN